MTGITRRVASLPSVIHQTMKESEYSPDESEFYDDLVSKARLEHAKSVSPGMPDDNAENDYSAVHNLPEGTFEELDDAPYQHALLEPDVQEATKAKLHGTGNYSVSDAASDAFRQALAGDTGPFAMQQRSLKDIDEDEMKNFGKRAYLTFRKVFEERDGIAPDKAHEAAYRGVTSLINYSEAERFVDQNLETDGNPLEEGIYEMARNQGVTEVEDVRVNVDDLEMVNEGVKPVEEAWTGNVEKEMEDTELADMSWRDAVIELEL